MVPSTLIPRDLPIPVEWGWFYLFQILTFVVHLLVMNAMLGAAIIALVHHLRGKAETEPLTLDISRKLPFTVAIAVNFGRPCSFCRSCTDSSSTPAACLWPCTG